MLQVISHGLYAEIIKQKRTTVYWFAFLAPLSMALLYLFGFNKMGATLLDTDLNPWSEMMRKSFQPIKALMLPLFMSVLTALVHFTDHRSHMWKHLFALPVSKTQIFLSKSLFSFLLWSLI